MQKRKITFKHRIEYIFFTGFISLVKLSPLFMMKFNKKLLRFLFETFSKRHTGVVARNLKLAFPNYSRDQRGELRENIYRHFSSVFVEIIYLFVKKKPGKILKPIEVTHLDYLEQALGKKKGVIMFSAHFGNWELTPYILSQNLDVKLNSIARKMDNPLVERKVLQFREFMGSAMIDKKNAIRTMLKRLEGNEIVMLLIDQNTIEQEAVFVDFFGHTVGAVPSVSMLHMKKHIPVLPFFVHYEKDKIVLEIMKELDTRKYRGTDVNHNAEKQDGKPGNNSNGKQSESVRLLTQQCTAIIEEKIRQYPEQWLWFHNRWKTKPPAPTQPQTQPGSNNGNNGNNINNRDNGNNGNNQNESSHIAQTNQRRIAQ
ncbi:MAG: lysophospholipid acyltransferase family protein [bacterium]|nr:lysophospholipid acyltransferase family protein [bacterium]